MKIGILGYGKEGQCAEKYFRAQDHEVVVFDQFSREDLPSLNLTGCDLILRSPSVHPQANWSSMTQYFFEHCPCKIIGVTGTKGKGTTCSIITKLFQALDQKVWLVGNIGTPALEVLDQISKDDVVVYELSSFQLWDLKRSPHIAVVLGIEPDHLNVHDSYEDYVNAKLNITKYQTPEDYCIYYKPNPDSKIIAKMSAGERIPYPGKSAKLRKALDNLAIPGQHNRNNAEAALLAVATWFKMSLKDFLKQFSADIANTLSEFEGLPHRLQFVRELNGVQYFDDNFSTTPTSLTVALDAFPEQKIILIAGGRDKTAGQDLPEIKQIIQDHQIDKLILIGESGHELALTIPEAAVAESLADAVAQARTAAEEIAAELARTKQSTEKQPASKPAEQQAKTATKTTAKKNTPSDEEVPASAPDVIVLMSPAAASFDMFDNVYDRGSQFQKLVQELQ